MKYIGAHVSAAGGLYRAPENARALGATAFALFVKNQRQWNSKPLTRDDIERFRSGVDACGIDYNRILPHDGYLINLANPDREKRLKSLKAFIDECRRSESLGLKGINFHPGSALDGGEREALTLIGDNLKIAASETGGLKFIVENTAGQGTALGYSFDHLAELIESSGTGDRIGVCFDTCHAWAAGYDLKERYDEVWEEFDRIIGFQYLAGMHLNDAKKELGSRVDRHAVLGGGTIGWPFFERLMKDPRMDDIPLILETPEPETWSTEISRLKEAAGNPPSSPSHINIVSN